MRLPTVNAMKWVILGIVIMALAAGLGRPAYAQGQVISGTVMSGSTPLASGTVQAYVGSFPCGSGQISFGGFSLTLPLGCGSVNTPVSFTVNNTQLAVASPQVLYTGSGSNNVVLTTSPGTTTGTTGVLGTGGHTISGRVVTSTGAGVPNTRVDAYIANTLCGSATTDALGNFNLFVAPLSQTPGCGVVGSLVSLRVGGQVMQTVGFLSGGSTPNVTLMAPAGTTPTTTIPTTTTPTTTTPTTPGTTMRVNAWFDKPPSQSGATPGCPAAGKWELRYWGGDTPAAVAVGVCPNVVAMWTRRGDKWLGFSRMAVGASDSWDLVYGEAHFLLAR